MVRNTCTDHGGAYVKQPIVIKGKLRYMLVKDKIVLGILGASTVSLKHIFVSIVE